MKKLLSRIMEKEIGLQGQSLCPSVAMDEKANKKTKGLAKQKQHRMLVPVLFIVKSISQSCCRFFFLGCRLNLLEGLFLVKERIFGRTNVNRL